MLQNCCSCAKTRLRYVENIFTVSALFILWQHMLYLLAGGPAQASSQLAGEDGSLTMRILYVTVYGVAAALLLPKWRNVLTLLIREKFILLIVLLAALSSFWSYAPLLTMRKFIGMAGATTVGIYLGTRFDLKRQLLLIAWTSGIIILVSIATVWLMPEIAVMSGFHEGAWRGLFLHKNPFGRFIVLSLVVFLLLHCSIKRELQWTVSGILVILSLLLCFSRAKAALLYGLLILLVALGHALWRRRMLSAVMFSVLALVLLLGSLSSLQKFQKQTTPSSGALPAPRAEQPGQSARPFAAPPPAASSTTSVTNLTGRIPLWMETLKFIAQRPLLGYGYEAFWNVHGPTIAKAWKSAWRVPHAHNGVLEIAISLGLTGLALFALSFVTASARSLRLAFRERNAVNLWPAAYMGFLFLVSMTDSVIIRPNSVHWTLYVALAVKMVPARKSADATAAVDDDKLHEATCSEDGQRRKTRSGSRHE